VLQSALQYPTLPITSICLLRSRHCSILLCR
jgi:hypothetical protein